MNNVIIQLCDTMISLCEELSKNKDYEKTFKKYVRQFEGLKKIYINKIEDEGEKE